MIRADFIKVKANFSRHSLQCFEIIFGGFHSFEKTRKKMRAPVLTLTIPLYLYELWNFSTENLL